MKLFCKRLALLAVSAFAAADAFAGGFQLNEHGARAMAQAGAFAARAYDGSAAYFNPAGFAFQDRGSAYLGGTLILPHTSFYGPLQLNTNTKTEMVSQTFTPVNATLSYPVAQGLVAAISVNNPYGLGTEWPDNWAGRYIIQKVELQTWFITPTVAYRLTDQFSLGFGLNYVIGNVKLKRAVSVVSVETPSPVEANLALNGNAVGFNAGILYKITPELSLGLSYRHKVKMDASGNASFDPGYAVLGLPQGEVKATLTLPATGFAGIAYRLTDQLSLGVGLNYVIGNVKLKRAMSVVSVETPSPVEADLALNGNAVGFNAGILYKITPELSLGLSYRHKVQMDASGIASFDPGYAVLGLPQGEVKSTLTLPATGFAGIAYRPLSNLEIEADYQFIGWSSYNELRFDFSSNNSSTVSPKNYQDTYIIRVGGEYSLDPWHFRGGYLYDHSPVKIEYSEPLLPDANRNGFNVGLGYDINPDWSVDVAYFFLLFQDRQAQNTIPDISFDGTYQSYVNLVGLNLEFKF